MSLSRTAFFASSQMRDIARGILSRKIKSFADKVNELQSAAPQIMAAAVESLTPAVRGELARNYAAAGLKEKTGALYSAAVSNARVTLRRGGLGVNMAAGRADKVYMIGAALNYGAVHAPRMGGTYKDLPTREARMTASGYRTAVGEKAKRTLKNYYFKGRAFSKRERFAAALAASAKTARGRFAGAKMIEVPDEMQVPRRSIRERMITAAVKNAGGLVIIRPHRFFYMSPVFKARAEEMLLAAVKRQISARGLAVE